MNGSNPATVEALNPSQILELNGALGRAVIPYIGELGGTSGLQRIICSPALGGAMKPLLIALSRGEIPTNARIEEQSVEQAVDEDEVFNNWPKLDGREGWLHTLTMGQWENIPEFGSPPPIKRALTKTALIPHLYSYSGGAGSAQLCMTLQMLIRFLRHHYEVKIQRPVDDDGSNVLDYRKQRSVSENFYYVRFDTRTWKTSSEPEKSASSIEEHFRDVNRIPMTLKEFLIIDFCYWLASGRKGHLQEGISQVCAGSRTSDDRLYPEVCTWNGGVIISSIDKSVKITDRRYRQVAIAHDNWSRFNPISA